MGSSLSTFGRIDLELEDSNEETASKAQSPPHRRTPPFGAIDLESIGETTPDSDVSRVHERPTRQNLQAARPVPVPEEEDETRVAKMESLARAVELANALEDVDAAPRSAPSTSGVASRDERVMRMRELYAQGNAEEALAVASAVSLELSEPSLPGDPFGGLIPVEDDELVEVEEDDGADAADTTAVFDALGDDAKIAMLTSQEVPRLLVDVHEIARLPVDPRAAFLLGHVDGIQTMEEILDVCAMPESEALELLARLRAMGVISFG